jgi:hypothetical protein
MFTDVSAESADSIIILFDLEYKETSVKFYQTIRLHIPEDSNHEQEVSFYGVMLLLTAGVP